MRPGKRSDKVVDDFPRTVGRAVIHGNDQHFFLGIFDCHQGAQNVGDNFFFVVRGYENGYRWPLGGVDVNVGMTLKAKQPVKREPVMAEGVDADDATMM